MPPDELNLRVATEEGVRRHPGIVEGEGDFTSAFGWPEPILKVTIQRVE